jgi:hypothetical protein
MRSGDDAEQMRATFDSAAGWIGLLKRYADAVTSANSS